MSTVTGLTAARMLAIEAASVIDGDIVGDNLILTKHDGSQINAGDVRGPEGPTGPVGSDTTVVSSLPVLAVGVPNQIRAGRQLTAADFTNIGLSAPIGLWNLSDLTDVSGNGRNLLNKGAVPFDSGINGVAATAARFSGSAAQVLYISDSGAADPFRIKSGSIGGWVRTAKRGVAQVLISKWAAGVAGLYVLYIGSGNFIQNQLTSDGNIVGGGVHTVNGTTDVCDDRWHFVVVTMDGSSQKLYVDGVLEATSTAAPIYSGSAVPFNLGGNAGDAATATASPHSGRMDETFVTGDVLSLEQIRTLYCSKIPHTLGTLPSRVSIVVNRFRRGAALSTADFPISPVRLHNFSAGSLGDEGSGAVTLTNSGGAVSISGADGTAKNGFSFAGAQALTSTDVGLPVGLSARSYGCWFKTISNGAAVGVMGWASGAAPERIVIATGLIRIDNGSDLITGPNVIDGAWHQIIVVEDNAAADGLKRKAYLDGRLIGSSTTLVSIASGGANAFAVGKDGLPGNFFIGQIDSAFVLASALTYEQIALLHAKASQAILAAPRNSADHIVSMGFTDILATFDTLESSTQVLLRAA